MSIALPAGEITPMDKGGPSRDDRTKTELLQPARNTEKGIKFNLSSTAPSGCFFTKEAGRETDELLEFAYELDYEKFMEDEEVRMALGAIKQRVDKMTAENNWQENMTG